MRKALIIAGLLLVGCTDRDPHAQFAIYGDRHARALDGDTFDFQGKRYRLARIDAPELPGHCRPGRHCVAGDPYAAKLQLQWMLDEWTACTPIGIDVYGRYLVECRDSNGINLNDRMMALGFAQRHRR
jgi:micrococcal nuclease